MKENRIRRSRFSYKIASELEYGLHFAAVLSRRDPFTGGALEVQQKMCERLEYGLHSAKVATGELALPVLLYAWVRSKAKAVSDGTKNFAHTQIY